MSKTHLMEIAAREADTSKAAASRAINAILDTIVESVAKNENIRLVSFGTFKSTQRAARIGRNPKTGKELKIAAITVPRFSPSATFKAVVACKKGAKRK